MARRSTHTSPADEHPSDTTPASTTSTTHSALPSAPSNSSPSRKRKSVAFDDHHDSIDQHSPAEASGSTAARGTRSHSSHASPSRDSNHSSPSSKVLGKRRAITPPASAPTDNSPSLQPSSKRSKPDLVAAAEAQDLAHALRPRPSPTTPLAQPTNSQDEDIEMPRKGSSSRASRSARTKALAMEDGDLGDVFLSDSGSSLAMDRRGSKHEDIKMNEEPVEECEETGGNGEKLPEETGQGSHSSSTGAGGGGGSDGDDDEDDDDHDDDDNQDDDDDDYDEDEDEVEQDMQDHERMIADQMDEYEASLGLPPGALSGALEDGLAGYHSGGGESDLIDPPQTFDANGAPLPADSTSSLTNRDRFDLDAALDAAEDAAADAAGLGGGGRHEATLRALQGIMSGMSGRLKGILTTLKNKSADSRTKLASLQDLAELLSVSTEDTLAGYFQTESFVKEIVSILRGDSNGTGGGGGGNGMTAEEMIAFGIDPDEASGGGGDDEENNVQMMLLACRCLANLMEALPGSAHSVVYAGAVPILCSKLLEIQYIDLAEQTLSTLEKVSEEIPSSIVREGGLGALLTYLDFFSFHVQRTAVTAAANCCRSLSPDSFKMVLDVMPIFKNVLGYPDQRVVEQACLAIVRIVDSYRHYPEKLEALLTADVLAAVRALLNPDSTTIGPRTYTQILKMLSTAAKASPEVAVALLDLNIGETLYHLLMGVAAPAFPSDEGPQMLVRPDDDRLVMQNLVQRPKEQIQETLGLLCELLPPLPKTGIFDSRAFAKDRSGKDKIKKEGDVADSTGTSTPAKTDADGDVKMERDAGDDAPAVASGSGSGRASPAKAAPVVAKSASASRSTSNSRSGKPRDSLKEAAVEKRLALLRSEEGSRGLVVRRYFALLLPTLVDVYAASVNTQVRTKAVLGMLKIVDFCDSENLAHILQDVPMAAFLAAMLAVRDQSPLVTSALQLVDLLLSKMPEAYQYLFRREGATHEIERLASAPILYVSSKSKKSSPSRTPTTGAAPSGIAKALQQHAAGDAEKKIASVEAQTMDMVTYRARYLRDLFANNKSEAAVNARAALDKIENLVSRLKDAVASDLQEEEVVGLLKDVSALFADAKNPLSSFELRETGMVEGLLKFSTEVSSTGLSVVERQELLAKAFLPQLEMGTPTVAFSILVKRLQESLSRMEEFEVVLASQNGNEGESKRDGTSMLARQLKLRLVAEEGSDIPRSCTNIVVSIHAVATFQAFNDYLRPRIVSASALADRMAAATSSSAPQAGGRLSSFLAAFAAADGSSPPPEASSSAALGARGSSSLGSEGRRRSERLSGKGVGDEGEGEEAVGEASTSKTTLEDEMPSEDHPVEDPDDDVCIDDGDGGLLTGAFDPATPSRDERPVNLEVADDGSKVIAKTPDGTRVGTPTRGDSTPRSSADPKPRASYAAAVKAPPTDFHLAFSMGDQEIGLDTTVYGAVHAHDAGTPIASRNMWQNIYTVTFRKVAGPAPAEGARSASDADTRMSSTVTLPPSIPAGSQQAEILKLLSVLHTINMDHSDTSSLTSIGIGEASFINNKLTAKLNRQLEEPMIVASACLPPWATDLPLYFPFLFPFETRYTFLQSTSFGYARLMQKWVGQARADSSRRDDNLGFLGRLQRQKVRISRDRMLESAFKVFELYGSSRASLEVEFFAEVGSGLGPTLEFYALVSKEFARKDLGLWRDGDAASESAFVFSGNGLFPNPMVDATSEAGKKALKVFRVLGQFVAKAMMDSRIMDVHFSKTFMKLVLNQELPLSIATVKTIDPALSKSLAHLEKYLSAKRLLDADSSLTTESRASAVIKIQVDGATLEDLTLDFTLPGHDIELKLDGKTIAVDIENVAEYIALVIDWTVKKGIALQVEEFKEGFSSVFSVGDLQSFTPSELVMLTGALSEDWSIEGLTNSTKADHGFTMDSRPVRDFLGIMSELTLAERREFLSFITGSPRLPIGGFAALTPSLTIVRKDGGDGSLPSVMTCVNYIKLPDYSTREIVKERIMTAVREGAGGFHLS